VQSSFLGSIGRLGVIGSLLLLGAAAVPAGAAGKISGTLTVPAGRSVEGAQINAEDARFHDFRSDVHADGTFTLDGLAPGDYTVVAIAKGLEPATASNVTVTDGQEVKRDFPLAEPKPYCIVKSPSAIPLKDDYNSTSFADAPEIHVDQPWQIVVGLGSGNLTTWDPTQVSGKFRLKYSAQALHLAADLTFKVPGAHNWPLAGDDIYDGNSIDLTLQNDPYNPKRDVYDLDHNWHIIVGLGESPVWKLLQAGYPPDDENNLGQSAAAYVLRQVKPTHDGELVRIDFPWSRFRQNNSKSGPIPVPKDNDLGAIDLSINGSDPDRPREKAALKNRLSWSGFFLNFRDPRVLRPAQFCPQAQ
jgi:hypothetical protein